MMKCLQLAQENMNCLLVIRLSSIYSHGNNLSEHICNNYTCIVSSSCRSREIGIYIYSKCSTSNCYHHHLWAHTWTRCCSHIGNINDLFIQYDLRNGHLECLANYLLGIDWNNQWTFRKTL